jgi:RNA recognition motif-containing protein
MVYMRDFQPVRAKILTDQEGNAKGQGFIHFESTEFATMAIQNLNNVEF